MVTYLVELFFAIPNGIFRRSIFLRLQSITLVSFSMLAVIGLFIFGANAVHAADTQVPSVPTNLKAVAVSPTQINLSWNVSTDNVGVTGYNIYRCTGSSCTPTTLISTSTTNSYSDAGLTASTIYTYDVSATDGINISVKSASVGETTYVQGVFFDDNFDLYTGNPENNGWIERGANVHVDKTGGYLGTRGIVFDYTKKGATPYWFGFAVDSSVGLNLYVKFHFKIVGTPTGGSKFLKIFGKQFDSKGYANTTFGLNQWAYNFQGTAQGFGTGVRNDTQNLISFKGPCTVGYSSCDPKIKIEIAKGAVSAHDGKWHTYEGHVRFNSNGKRNGVIEVWIDNKAILRAVNVRNRNDDNSEHIARVDFGNYTGDTFSTPWKLYIDDVVASKEYIGPIGAIAAPANLKVTPVSPTQINLSWATSTYSGVTGYNIYRCTGSSCTPTTLISTSTTNSYSDNGLTASTTYLYTVSAFDVGLNTSKKASVVSAVTISNMILSFYNTTKNVIRPHYGSSIPRKGESRTDPVTGARLTRMSDRAEMGTAKDGMIVYSRFSPTNTTEKYLLVHGTNSTSCYVYRTSDNIIVADLKRDATHQIGEINEIRWDYTGNHPTRVYFVSRMKFYEMDVLSGNGNPTLIHDFSIEYPDGALVMNDVEGDSSDDSRYWAFMVRAPYDGARFPLLRIITYDKKTDSIIGVLKPSDVGYSGTMPIPNMVEISPLGTKVITHYGICWGAVPKILGPWIDEGNGIFSSKYRLYTAGNNVFSWVKSDGSTLTKVKSSTGLSGDITGDNQWASNSSLNKLYVRLSGESPSIHDITLSYGKRVEDIGSTICSPYAWNLNFTNPINISVDETHSGWAFDTNGKEWFVSQNNKTDWIEARNILTGEAINILYNGDFGWHSGMHFGKIYDHSIRGWFLMSTVGDDPAVSSDWGSRQIIMVQLKDKNLGTPKVWRISPTYNNLSGYRGESSTAFGFKGDSVFLTTSWGASSGADAYKIDLPADWYKVLSNGFVTTDASSPTIFSFTIPSTSSSYTISIKTLHATDNIAVTGYCLSETNNYTSCNTWNVSAPTSYTFSTNGSHTLYSFAEDSAGNISSSASAIVTVNVPIYKIGGTYTGPAGSIIVQNNSGDDHVLATNGAFTFATPLSTGDAYNVTVLSKPTGETCSVSQASGKVSNSDVTNVVIQCKAKVVSNSGTPHVSGGGSFVPVLPSFHTTITTKTENSDTKIVGDIATLATSTQTTSTDFIKPKQTLAQNVVIFQRTLWKGKKGADVKRLQELLNSDADTRVATNGIGSKGHEIEYFGNLTEKAVRKFQLKYHVVSSAKDPGYGLVGPKTRSVLERVFAKSAKYNQSTQTELPSELKTTHTTLKSNQIESIIELITAFGADKSVIDKVRAELGTPVITPPTTTSSVQTVSLPLFTKNLQLHDKSAQVKYLQQYLNQHGFYIVKYGAGSKGHETTYFGIRTYDALIRFQKSRHIPATGWFGPMTRHVVEG